MSGERTRDWVKVRFPNAKLGNSSYNSWSEQEDKELLKYVQKNISISEIAKIHQRTVGAIRKRIKRLNSTQKHTLLEDDMWNSVSEECIRSMIDVIDNINKNSIKANSSKMNMLDIHALAREVYTLGGGYSERVYHNAMEVLLRKAGIPYETERIVPITFQGHVIGNLRADIIINNEIVLEFKTIKNLTDQTEMQARNYLSLTGLKIGYLINYPPFPDREVEVRCIVAEEQLVETSSP
jgi:GxxExxY protein